MEISDFKMILPSKSSIQLGDLPLPPLMVQDSIRSVDPWFPFCRVIMNDAYLIISGYDPFIKIHTKSILDPVKPGRAARTAQGRSCNVTFRALPSRSWLQTGSAGSALARRSTKNDDPAEGLLTLFFWGGIYYDATWMQNHFMAFFCFATATVVRPFSSCINHGLPWFEST